MRKVYKDLFRLLIFCVISSLAGYFQKELRPTYVLICFRWSFLKYLCICHEITYKTNSLNVYQYGFGSSKKLYFYIAMFNVSTTLQTTS